MQRMRRQCLAVLVLVCVACGDDSCPSGTVSLGSRCAPAARDGGELEDSSSGVEAEDSSIGDEPEDSGGQDYEDAFDATEMGPKDCRGTCEQQSDADVNVCDPGAGCTIAMGDAGALPDAAPAYELQDGGTCSAGYRDDGQGTCKNIDDCPAGACAHGSCLDGVNDYTCKCNDGFLGTGSKDCKPTIAGLALGQVHTCAMRTDGTVACWGANNLGQLGDGTTVPSSAAVSVSGLVDAVEISAGLQRTCVRKASGAVACWGQGAVWNGAIGRAEDAREPTAIGKLTDVVQLNSSAAHSCAVRGDGTVWCWGDNTHGQLGIDWAIPRSGPGEAGNGIRAVRVVTGLEHTCVVESGESVWCWGSNERGQLGAPTPSSGSYTPVIVTGLASVVSLSAGGLHMCALKMNSTVACWGSNDAGQLGAGGAAYSSTPSVLKSLSNVMGVSAGGRHTCAFRADGAAFCWGRNASGQLGNGSTMDSSPTRVSGLTAVTVVASGDAHTCASRNDGTVFCWGENASGQLGNGMTTNSSVPVQVVGL